MGEAIMNNSLKLSKNQIQKLKKVISESHKLIETERGALFGTAGDIVMAIKLTVSINKYLKFINSLGEKKPAPKNLIPITGENSDFILFGDIGINGRLVTIDGKEITIL